MLASFESGFHCGKEKQVCWVDVREATRLESPYDATSRYMNGATKQVHGALSWCISSWGQCVLRETHTMTGISVNPKKNMKSNWTISFALIQRYQFIKPNAKYTWDGKEGASRSALAGNPDTKGPFRASVGGELRFQERFLRKTGGLITELVKAHFIAKN